MRGCSGGGGGVHGCFWGCVVFSRGHAWFFSGRSAWVFPGGHEWFFQGGVNERAVRILLECILVLLL